MSVSPGDDAAEPDLQCLTIRVVRVCVCVCVQCDGRPIPLPSLQGIAVLNIPSYAGGTNFWGGTKEDDVRTHLFIEQGQVISDVMTSPVYVYLSDIHCSVLRR